MTAFATGPAGFVGLRVGLGPTVLPAGRHRLRHGHLTVAGGRATVSVPPSPGLDVCAARAAEDLAAARALAPGPAGAHGVRVCLDAGHEGPGPGGYRRRWAVAHAIGPALVAAFANTPGGGWASARLGPRLAAPGAVPGGGEPRAAWAAHRRSGATWAPVTARGFLELDLADGPDWLVPLAVTTALLHDARAAAEALDATAHLGRDAWVRAARHGRADAGLAAAGRACLFAAYAALARQGVDRATRDAVAARVALPAARGPA
ncbi:hypothetical protein [Spirilliplanes yamanashiensis]|uniref:Uncharacterized protein n=1 Tax=Spirilliplanes yamanashiensis TaxID=42233 RepID=A0A8J3Y9H1_9ACTN|nr:hypothetical protein [Spirilliplanes yamanashiensis]MDP9817651.1 glutamate--cysteine ligase [Spirilliplanes yamanashiensis]GIJ04461.1 hypothetical protein Sya03_38130 [Spirilliplanes yamanashiensis]